MSRDSFFPLISSSSNPSNEPRKSIYSQRVAHILSKITIQCGICIARRCACSMNALLDRSIKSGRNALVITHIHRGTDNVLSTYGFSSSTYRNDTRVCSRAAISFSLSPITLMSMEQLLEWLARMLGPWVTRSLSLSLARVSIRERAHVSMDYEIVRGCSSSNGKRKIYDSSRAGSDMRFACSRVCIYIELDVRAIERERLLPRGCRRRRRE